MLKELDVDGATMGSHIKLSPASEMGVHADSFHYNHHPYKRHPEGHCLIFVGTGHVFRVWADREGFWTEGPCTWSKV